MILIELAGGGAVAAAHLVGVDLQPRPQVDLRAAALDQARSDCAESAWRRRVAAR